jgi:hypothetical protein
VLTSGQVADAVARLASVRWSWWPEDVDRLAADIGWPVDSRPTARDAYLRTGYPTGAGLAFVHAKGSTPLEYIDVPVADYREDWHAPARVDLFAMAASAAIGVLGEPTYRRTGERPTVVWPAAGGVFEVQDYGHGLQAVLNSTRYAAYLQAEAEQLAEEQAYGSEHYLESGGVFAPP